jgi:hypothetical protein
MKIKFRAPIFLCVALLCTPVKADEVWFCSTQDGKRDPRLVEYRIENGEMTDLSAVETLKSLGLVDESITKFKIIEDTAGGVVALQSETKRADQGENLIWANLILIDKESGGLRNISISNTSPAKEILGHCGR